MEAIIVLTTSALFLFFWTVMRMLALPKVIVSNRVGRIIGGATQTRVTTKVQSKRLRQSQLQKLSTALLHADIKMDAREFLVRWCAVAVCCIMALVLWAGVGSALVGFAAYYMATHYYLRARQRQRRRKFNDALADMLTVVANSMRAGHSFVQALHIVTEDTSGPLQEELLRVESEMQVGVSLDEALLRSNARVGSEDYDIIVTAIGIQRQVGGNLAEVLDKITETIRERVSLKREVKALTSQGRLSATIFMLLPIGVGLMLFIINPVYMAIMFHSTLGVLLLVVAGMGQLFGYFIIRRIVRVEL